MHDSYCKNVPYGIKIFCSVGLICFLKNFLVGHSMESKTTLSVKLGPEHGFSVDHFTLKGSYNVGKTFDMLKLTVW